jgi:XTP/dITP diphosphohydrolase
MRNSTMIKKVILATGNLHKAEEIISILKDLNIEIIPMTHFPKYIKAIEDGQSLEENAVKKAKKASEFFKEWTIADDSGLEVDYLDGAPGIYSARYAGEKCTYNDNNKKLLAALGGVSQEKRTAKFKTVIALSSPDGKICLAKGEIFGTIVSQVAGANGFGYDSIFYVPEYGKTFSELSFEIKNSISHRAKALQKVRKIVRVL